MNVSRRNFLKLSVGSAALAGSPAAYAKAADSVAVPKRKFGRHDDMVSVFGIGGHTLYLSGSQEDANEIVARAVDLGVNFFDNAWDYHGGEAEVYMGNALKGKRDKVFLMSKFCNYHNSIERAQTAAASVTMLDETLKRLKTDHLDLWLMHQVSHNDLEDAYRADGALEAIEMAKKQGKIRYAGFSGHTDPQLNYDMIDRGYEWDAVLMPISSVGAMGSRKYEKLVIPICEKKGVAVLGMKGFGGSRRTELHKQTSAEKVLQYSLSHPQLCTQIMGIDKVDYVNQAAVASMTKPFTVAEREAYAAQFEFAPGTPEFAAQYHGEKLYEEGSCCLRRDKENA